MTVSYAKERHQFGQPIGSFQAVQHKCANMRIWLQASTVAAYYAAMVYDSQEAGFAQAAAVAKSAASRFLTSLAGEALQIHGGIGMSWESDVHLLLRRIELPRCCSARRHITTSNTPRISSRACSSAESERPGGEGQLRTLIPRASRRSVLGELVPEPNSDRIDAAISYVFKKEDIEREKSLVGQLHASEYRDFNTQASHDSMRNSPGAMATTIRCMRIFITASVRGGRAKSARRC